MSAAPAAGPRGAAPRGAAWLAWSTLACSLLLVLVAAGMLLVVDGAATYDYAGLFLVNAPVLAIVGALVAARRPDHPIGWLFTGMGLAASVALVLGSYAAAALADDTLSAGAVAAWVAEELRLATLGALVLVLLLFPTGRLPSRRWRVVLWLGVIGLVALMADEGLTPGRGEHLLGYDNPFGLAALSGLLEGLGVLAAAFGLAELAAVLSLVVRLRQARGVERQQLKWFVYAAVLALVALVAANLLVPELMEHGLLGHLLWGSVPVSLAVAVAVAVAVLRYRLYDIDRLVNRTLVYGLLTAILAVVYAGMVLVPGQLFGGVGGTRRAGQSPAPPWPPPRCSSRPAGAFRPSWIGASTGAGTTPPRRSRPSARGSVMRSTSTRCRRSCWRSSIRRCSQPERRFGFDRPRTAPGVHLPVGPGLVPDPEERSDFAPLALEKGWSRVKTPQGRTTSSFRVASKSPID